MSGARGLVRQRSGCARWSESSSSWGEAPLDETRTSLPRQCASREESFRLFEPGRIGAAKDAPYTLFNYAELAEPAYLYYFVETVRFGLVSSVIALAIAFPIAYLTARQPSPLLRRLAIGFLIGMMF